MIIQTKPVFLISILLFWPSFLHPTFAFLHVSSPRYLHSRLTVFHSHHHQQQQQPCISSPTPPGAIAASVRCSTFQLYAKKQPNKAANKGFGNISSSSSSSSRKSNAKPLEKTYGITPIIPHDEQAAMTEFFAAHTEWHPLFASIALHDQVPACTHLDLKNKTQRGLVESSSIDDGDNDEDVLMEFQEGGGSTPWRKLPPMPTGPQKDHHMKIISTVLDHFQKALVDIPLSDELYSKNAEDDNEMHFIEEGRRLLVLERFQVLDREGAVGRGMGQADHLFQTCWSEIHHLVSSGGRDTGSLIILDEYDDDGQEMDLDLDLGQFVDSKIRLPLRFLGLEECVEVASFVRGKSCVRLIHQLGDVPSLESKGRDEYGFE